MSQAIADDPLAEACRLAGANNLFVKRVSEPVRDAYPPRYAPAWKVFRKPAYYGGRWIYLGKRTDPAELLALVKRLVG